MSKYNNKQSSINYSSCANPEINDCTTCTVHASNGAGGKCYWNPTKENQTNENTCTVGECSAFQEEGYGSTCSSNTPAPTKQTCSTPHPSPLQPSSPSTPSTIAPYTFYPPATNTPAPNTPPPNTPPPNTPPPNTPPPNTPAPNTPPPNTPPPNTPPPNTPAPSAATTAPAATTAETTFTDLFKDVFTNTTMTIVFWVASAYVIYKIGSSIMAPRELSAESSGQLTYSRTIDFILAGLLAAFVFSTYYQIPENEKTNIFGWFLSWTYIFFNNPWSVLELFWFTIIFFILVYLLRVPMAPDVKPVLVGLVEHKIWIFYASFAIIFFFKYLLNIPIVDILLNNSVVRYFEDLPTSTPAPTTAPAGTSAPTSYWDTLTKDVNSIFSTTAPTSTPALGSTPAPTSTPALSSTSAVPTTAPVSTDKQVFNVSNNIYTYDDAQKVCQAFDAELASYDQVENAYNAGGEWCNYGWSAGQMAFFPTQKSTWKRLQRNDETKNACGRPGINGGYFANPYIKFGANCYGVKPAQPEGWEPEGSSIRSAATTIPRESDEQRKLRTQAEINSFNDYEWSRYSHGAMHTVGTTKPGTTKPGTTKPGTTMPGTTKPGTTKPGTTKPGTTMPGTTKPGTTKPGTTMPGTTKPGTTMPGTTKPGTTKPGTTMPGTTMPGTTMPGTTKPILH